MLRIDQVTTAAVGVSPKLQQLVADKLANIRSLEREMGEYVVRLEAAQKDDEDESSKNDFSMLMALTKLEVELSDIADSVGTSKSTVLRWADGQFSPPQKIVRAAILREVHKLLTRLLLDHQQRLVGDSGRHVPRGASERFVPVKVRSKKSTTADVVKLKRGK